jgi:hypothetical protein
VVDGGVLDGAGTVEGGFVGGRCTRGNFIVAATSEGLGSVHGGGGAVGGGVGGAGLWTGAILIVAATSGACPGAVPGGEGAAGGVLALAAASVSSAATSSGFGAHDGTAGLSEFGGVTGG